MLPEIQYRHERADDDYEGETAQIEDIEEAKSAFSNVRYGGDEEDDYVDQETAIANPLDYP
jgi:hypothetical protein